MDDSHYSSSGADLFVDKTSIRPQKGDLTLSQFYNGLFSNLTVPWWDNPSLFGIDFLNPKIS